MSMIERFTGEVLPYNKIFCKITIEILNIEKNKKLLNTYISYYKNYITFISVNKNIVIIKYKGTFSNLFLLMYTDL